MRTSETTTKIWGAILKAQDGMPAVEKNGYNSHTKSKYPRLADILTLVRPRLNANGAVLTQTLGDNVVTTRITHAESGEYVEVDCKIVVGNGPNPMHSIGSAMTYGCRYGLSGLLGIEAVEDDDGNGSSSGAKVVKTTLLPPSDAVLDRLYADYTAIQNDWKEAKARKDANAMARVEAEGVECKEAIRRAGGSVK